MATPTTLPASFTAGQVLTAAQMNNLRGAFRVLQVVTASTGTQVSNSTNIMVDSGLTATITPQSATSTILVMVSQNNIFKSSGNAQNRLEIQLVRGATVLSTFGQDFNFTATALDLCTGSVATFHLDSPATTSATTYKTRFMNPGNAASVAVQWQNTGRSTITLLEISA